MDTFRSPHTRAVDPAALLMTLLLLAAPAAGTSGQAGTGPPPGTHAAPSAPLPRISLVAVQPASGPATTLAPTRLSTLCAGGRGPEPMAQALAERRARASGDIAAFTAFLDSLDAALEDAPDGLDTRYRRAMVAGVRIETLDGRDRVEAADQARIRAEAVLELDPGHPGAHFILGRLHAAVSRLGTLKRLAARAVTGGDLLAMASWSSARRHFERAEAGSPCIAEHHFELARLLAERDQPTRAAREFRHVLELATGEGARAALLRTRSVRELQALR